MRKKLHKILVTGGAGFIGSAFVRLLVKRGFRPIVIDKLTYAGDLKRLDEARGGFKFYRADICNKRKIEEIFKKEKPDIVVHFAAESHVDRSINDATPFIETNIKGTQILIDASRKYNIKKFIFMSTDEVYGEIARGKFGESSPIRPNSPYAASKAAADLLVQSYIRTYNFPAIIIRPCNNYGPWQYPEKLIPLAILRVLSGEKVPVYGKGQNVREWLHVDDCAGGILKIINRGRLGEVYNLGSGRESRNIDTVKLLLRALKAGADRFEFVLDRLGHDLRYSLDSHKVYNQIRWRPAVNFNSGITQTVNWCVSRQDWLKSKSADIAVLYKH